jgi:uncharacterized peroxidase-related enzyme
VTQAPTTPQWQTVDEGWGRRAAEFASTLEPASCREYAAMHHHVDVHQGDRLLDVACGSGLALELAAIRGAHVSGIDASPRLVEIARDRSPDGDIRVGDMTALPWADATFDVVTSFRGIWATTIDALAEARRVLRPGGRIAVTTWGHVKVSPGFWALSPFSLAAHEKVRAQADMKSLGRPGVGEQLLADAGFEHVQRHRVPFVWEFPDPEAFARAIASTGPAFEAIQQVGDEEFHRYCIAVATERVRQGLPLRAELDCVGLTATVPEPAASSLLLGEATVTPASTEMAADDLAELGFVTNGTRLWMHDPEAVSLLFDTMRAAVHRAHLSVAERGIAVITATSLIGDTYCPLAWGQKLATQTTPEVAASVLDRSDDQLDERGKAIAAWASVVAGGHTASAADLDRLREAGFSDDAILGLTHFIALRMAFSTVNLALGARPEEAYLAYVAPAVRDAWTRRFA